MEDNPNRCLYNLIVYQLRLQKLGILFISRKIYDITDSEVIEQHDCCMFNASQIAYGSCVYLRTQYVNSHLHLLYSRVAPLKVISVQRLELCGAWLL